SNGNGKKNLSQVCGAGLNDNAGSIGLPQNGQNSNYDPKNANFVKINQNYQDGTQDGYVYQKYSTRETYQSFAREMSQKQGVKGTSLSFDIGGKIGKPNSEASGVYVKSLPSNKNIVPDVYSLGSSKDMRPCFAKIVVELGEGDKVTVYKENTLANRTAKLWSGKSADIKNGIISVNGGNVEVRSETDNSGKAKNFTGDITIVADVDGGREDSLAYSKFTDPKTSNGKGQAIKDGTSIYSDLARDYQDLHPNEPPPYQLAKLVSAAKKDKKLNMNDDKCVLEANKGRNKDAYVWPTPTSEAVEREGNIFITSDIQCGTSNGKRGAVGIIAKNYVSLNDKTALKKGKNAADQTLNIEAMLFSFDKSVQFDWDNSANFGISNDTFKALQKNAKNRKFNLTGCVVSSNLDIEGSEEGEKKAGGVGYLKQEEKSNVSLESPPPFMPAYSEGEARWVIISYEDKGSRNWF
ncbi:hypothetical protein IJT17_10575, partial [bacterium]|nr:hypothetical protein [bacterium]